MLHKYYFTKNNEIQLPHSDDLNMPVSFAQSHKILSKFSKHPTISKTEGKHLS